MPSMFALLRWFYGWAYKTAKAPTLSWCFGVVGFFTVPAACQLDAALPAINAGGGTSGVCFAQTGAVVRQRLVDRLVDLARLSPQRSTFLPILTCHL